MTLVDVVLASLGERASVKDLIWCNALAVVPRRRCVLVRDSTLYKTNEGTVFGFRFLRTV